VSRSREKYNIRSKNGSKTTYNVIEDPETDIDSEKYLRNSYRRGDFNSKIASLRKSNQKVVVISNGREMQRQLYQRD
jgi:hypothetical protein